MITFTLDLPRLSDSQQLQLEEALLKVPKVDALALNDDSGDFVITLAKDNAGLRDAVAALYGWASSYPGLLAQMRVRCPQDKEMELGKHSPNDIIYFLAACY